ncbi:type I restriction-modification system subunit M [Lachnospiraceae bacterium NSJ-143]|nr:type I restriction-modification system subunit M [Lachnospiraceae bacterium NSJ-143]
MNKKQLAATIWKSANEMRSKIEANEYKDYILGFIFYKYLSEKEMRFFVDQGMSEDEIRKMDESDEDFVNYTKDTIGYFISYENLFSTWIDKSDDFDVSDVRTALSAFNRLISDSHKKVFEKIFNTLQTGLSKLGETASTQTKSINNLIKLIKKIPMDGKQDYDILGFIYEYLISQFAANAGKKAGEFYTPHEVSVLMSEIVANHLKGRKEIRIYDPTSGSGSLLINIGSSVAKYLDGNNRITYYAQELKENTFNLTRMNLVMRGIDPANIYVRNGDTLEEDWPFFDGEDIEHYQLVRVDALVSNPPYSQKWDPKGKKHDPRFSDYGVAPKGKADFAFLLHELYHLEEDGIMTIVLPHGVLFRGNEEYTIRKNLVEKNNIDAIIGLPANIFFGTPIQTLVMVLKRQRKDTDILIIDASKGFEKAGKSNKLRSSDIKRIVDCICDRAVIPGFSERVSKETVRENDYNLNIPRYVDSFEQPEPWDLHSIMFGGIPNTELDQLEMYWTAFPGLRTDICKPLSDKYVQFVSADIDKVVRNHASVIRYRESYIAAFSDLREQLKQTLIGNYQSVSPLTEEDMISTDIFRRLETAVSIDKYEAFQALDDAWGQIATDLEIIQTEGDASITQVDPHLVTKKKDDKEIEVQDGWEGHILPFELVQEMLLTDETHELRTLERKLASVCATYNDLIDTLSDEEKDTGILNDTATAFVTKEVKAKVAEVLDDIENDEILALQEYLALPKKDKSGFVERTKTVDWAAMEPNKSGLYTKAVITERINKLKQQYNFPEETYESKLKSIVINMDLESELRKKIREKASALHEKTKLLIENMEIEQALQLLEEKWNAPIIQGIMELPENLIRNLIIELVDLSKKYAVTFSEVGTKIDTVETNVSGYLSRLTGDAYDTKGLAELKHLLGGE